MPGFRDDPRAFDCPLCESPFFEPLLAAQRLPPDIEALVRRFREDGLLVLPGFIEPELVDRVASDCRRLFAARERLDVPREFDGPLHQDPARKQDAWIVSEAVRDLAGHPRVVEALAVLYGRRPFPFQTLDFLSSPEQHAHSDAIHFNSLPARFMAGAWVALEDVDEQSGPLCYYPGSHRLPDVHPGLLRRPAGDYAAYEQYVEALIEAHGLRRELLVAAKGTLVLWSANLLHGSTPVRRAGATRLSQVTHYFFEDCVYYTPLRSDVSVGELYLRRVRDVRTGRPVPPRVGGRPARVRRLGHGRARRLGGQPWWRRLGGRLLDAREAWNARRATAALERLNRRGARPADR